MDKAKAAVSDFLHKDGKHDTTVHEKIAPAVQHETVKPHHHTNATTAVDREVHQDHYHTSVQPVHDREVLPEQHHHKLGEVEHRKFDHRDHEHTKNHLATEAAKFKDHQVVEPTKHTQTAAPVVGGEHVHHHIHETIQPVIHKETIQPHVTHHTKPIHETHHHAAQHHTSTELPAVSLADFKSKGGVLGGRGEKYDAFEGEPRGLSGLTHGHHKHDSAVQDGTTGTSHHITGTAGTTGLSNNSTTPATTGATGSHLTGSHANTTGTGFLDSHSNKKGSGITGTKHHPVQDTAGVRGDTYDSTGTQKKASLVDRLNPLKDADGDGKKGIMS